jgi:hypothetical protein
MEAGMVSLPLWMRIFAAALSLLIVNLLWNDPLAGLTGGGSGAFILLNLLPSAIVVLFLFDGAVPERTQR